MTRYALLGAICLAALAGCSSYQKASITAPKPLDVGGEVGFVDKQLEPGVYEVLYFGPYARTSVYGYRREAAREAAKEFSYDMALWRIAEISDEEGDGAFEVVESETDVEVDTSHIPRLFLGFGSGFGHHRHSHFHYGAHYRLFGPYGNRDGHLYSPSYHDRAYVQADAKLVARLVPRDTPGAFTAEKVMRGVAEKYQFDDYATEPAPGGESGSDWKDPDQAPTY